MKLNSPQAGRGTSTYIICISKRSSFNWEVILYLFDFSVTFQVLYDCSRSTKLFNFYMTILISVSLS